MLHRSRGLDEMIIDRNWSDMQGQKGERLPPPKGCADTRLRLQGSLPHRIAKKKSSKLRSPTHQLQTKYELLNRVPNGTLTIITIDVTTMIFLGCQRSVARGLHTFLVKTFPLMAVKSIASAMHWFPQHLLALCLNCLASNLAKFTSVDINDRSYQSSSFRLSRSGSHTSG
ncbi:predicted protein [Sclerotinia sclerotiorum 1980 UF-70]|uniref:Uncharacterized protein n=1 Tax=Sclerotinia sclerotiorum (strain ATCC 18683 / 1980 / Ss-1) TaxID=665079 RepID=A7EIX5_SCLS1|nr:predicted protein [Sclerotinia sclerotiorum 1980 UF-70]EDO02791.1 predicted protein [Sclerotinia sclerotiorum 1980 UF-70]